MPLHAEQLAFAYRGSATLFANVSFTLQEGERVVLLGDNAAGKSTLLRVCAGIQLPRHGRVTVDGRPVAPRDIGMVFQNPDDQLLAATVESEIALALELRGESKTEMRPKVDTVLERFELSAIRSRIPTTLSGGQKQRVALAAVMIAEPRFLLLDEPDSYLDATARRQFAAAVQLVAGCGVLWTASSTRNLPAHDRLLRLTAGGIVKESV